MHCVMDFLKENFEFEKCSALKIKKDKKKYFRIRTRNYRSPIETRGWFGIVRQERCCVHC